MTIIPRYHVLQKVIEGEQGGVSKDLKWQGAGSFVNIELMEKNRGFLKSIIHFDFDSKKNKYFHLLLDVLVES